MEVFKFDDFDFISERFDIDPIDIKNAGIDTSRLDAIEFANSIENLDAISFKYDQIGKMECFFNVQKNELLCMFDLFSSNNPKSSYAKLSLFMNELFTFKCNVLKNDDNRCIIYAKESIDSYSAVIVLEDFYIVFHNKKVFAYSKNYDVETIDYIEEFLRKFF